MPAASCRNMLTYCSCYSLSIVCFSQKLLVLLLLLMPLLLCMMHSVTHTTANATGSSADSSERGNTSFVSKMSLGLSWRENRRRESAPAAAGTAAAAAAATELGNIQLQMTDHHLRGPHAPRLRVQNSSSFMDEVSHVVIVTRHSIQQAVVEHWSEKFRGRGN